MQAKLVNEYELANMKVKSKPNEMDLVNWIRFEDRWKNWKKLQDPGRDLSTSLMDSVQNARNEVTNKLGNNYDEDWTISMIMTRKYGFTCSHWSRSITPFSFLA